MNAVTVSSKFQVIIPADVRAKMHVKAGQKFRAIARAHDATLWTQDDDFSGIPGVRYFTR